MRIFTLEDKQELSQYQNDIEALFLECFGDKASVSVWAWAYLQNPAGEPIVSLCYDGARLVGHYAVIPMPLSRPDGVENSYLSMTTMVASDYRQYGLFVKLAQETYEVARRLGVDFVFGFPNALSTPGFRKRLNWFLPPADYIASVNKRQLIESGVTSALVQQDRYRLDFSKEGFREWRLSKPGNSYVRKEGLIYKQFDGAIDLIYFDSPVSLEGLPDGQAINVLLPHDVVEFRENKILDYQFGGISINEEFRSDLIGRQMCMSDVF